MVTISPFVVREAASGARQLSKEGGTLSIEVFGFDFVSLIVKLLIYFFIAVIIDKFHYVVGVLSLGGLDKNLNIVGTILLAFGFNLPTREPNFLRDLFSEDGLHGIKYWDLVKFGSMILVFIEGMMYYQTQKRLGGSPSPFTLGIFAMIMLLLSAFTIPELIDKLRARRGASVVSGI